MGMGMGLGIVCLHCAKSLSTWPLKEEATRPMFDVLFTCEALQSRLFLYAQIRIRDALLSRKKKKGLKTPKRTGPFGRTCSGAIVY